MSEPKIETLDANQALKNLVRNIRAVAGYFGIDAKTIADRAGKTPQSVSYMWNEKDRGLTIPLVYACNDALLDIITELKGEDVPLKLYSNSIAVLRQIEIES